MTFAKSDILALRQEFPIFERTLNGKRLVFLDSAASSQKPRVVLQAMMDLYTQSYANVHRGLYTLAEETTEAYEGARAKIARFIHAADPAEVIHVRNATEGLNLIAYTWGEANIRPGDRIVITEMEHHANFVPWQQLAQRRGAELVYTPITEEGQIDMAAFQAMLYGGRTRLVACTMMSNVLGTIPDIAAIIAQAHAAGAVVVVDGAQSVPHMPVDVQALGADFLAFSGHKMCGPGVGILWGRRALLEEMPPFLFGGDMIRTVKKEGALWNDLPHKFEAGTPAIGEIVGLGAAVDFLGALGMENVRAHECALTAYALEHLPEVPGLHLLGPHQPEQRGGAISFWFANIHPHDIAAVLNEEAICVRAGHHCAQPLHIRYGIPASTRASLYLYNDSDDIDALVAGLHKVVKLLGR